ncbi:PIN-like domain-containing protein [Streptomyces sp. NPDC056525]|uniref:PIN-like domain-containing protein n=1 Tax=unclassified Streptomyces TaxID=2593676 RepID=UPI0036C9DF8C
MRTAFSEYYTPDDEEYGKFVREGMIVLDANVLLSPYRVDADTKKQVFSVLEDLKERIWVPYQAGWEFFQNRPNVLGGEDKVYANLEKPLEQALNSLQAHMKTLKGHPVVTSEEQSRITRHLDDALALVRRLSETRDEKLEDALRTDSVLLQWESVLTGRIGEAPTEAVREERLKEAEERYSRQAPPGYKDADKPLANRYGDALLWLELLDFLKGRGEGIGDRVLLVTNDTKEDWYREQSGRTIGPRVELIKEMEGIGVSYYQQPLSGFLRRSSQFLQKAVSQEAIQQVKRASISDYREYEAIVISVLNAAFPEMENNRGATSNGDSSLPDVVIDSEGVSFGVEIRMRTTLGLKDVSHLQAMANISRLAGLLVVTPGRVTESAQEYLEQQRRNGGPIVTILDWVPDQEPIELIHGIRRFRRRLRERKIKSWEKP